MAVRPLSRPHALRRARLLVIALCWTLAAAAACARGERTAGDPEAGPVPGDVTAIREGMSKDDVLSRWGTPNVRVRDSEGERWSYWIRDERQQVVGKAYVVFDEEERVSEVVARPSPGTQPQDDKRAREPVTVTRANSTHTEAT